MSDLIAKKEWISVGSVSDFVVNAGGAIQHGIEQIAVFNFEHKEWYATQNLCPHRQEMVLSRGLLGCKNGKVKVACPLHKNNFDLASGEHLDGDQAWCLKTYEVKVESESVYLLLEPIDG